MSSDIDVSLQRTSGVQASQVTYELHSLGWKGFQDLCLAVAEEILRRPVESFLPSRDGGRDGAFIGRWKASPDTSEPGRSTIQCKFTSRKHATLRLSDVSEELDKAHSLSIRGLADDYILLTNHMVSGENHAAIVEAFEAVGVGRCQVFGGSWISQQIQESPRLRVMVPRVYGLGDLSQILDERALAQSRAILSALGDDLARFVITDAHRKSVRALLDHQFVLLLGDPASGKSTIAASLALGALDHWGCPTIRITSPMELTDHWNPHEPTQFFWIDDAFGPTQYQRQSADSWNQQLPLLNAAIRKGARFLLTSRTYIWRAARKDLKTGAFPLFNSSQVIIDVQGLSLSEKAQILYNHIKLGDQSAEFRKTVKPYLAEMAADDSFLPEIARRLGSKFFTPGLSISRQGIMDFAQNPVLFLKDVLRNLDHDGAAAIALVFMHGGALPSPIERDERAEIVSELLGVPMANIRRALEVLQGSLVLLVEAVDGLRWTFKHPTIGDAHAALVAESPELTVIYLRGAKLQQLLKEVVCQSVDLEGAAMRIPPSLYDLLLERISAEPMSYSAKYFFSQRSDARFLIKVVEKYPQILDTRLGPFMGHSSDIDLLAKLHKFGLLPEEKRKFLVKEIRDITVDTPDGAILRNAKLKSLVTHAEFEEILDWIRQDVIERLDDQISDWRANYDGDNDPESYFDELDTTLQDAELAFSDELEIVEKIEVGREDIRRTVESLMEDYESRNTSGIDTPNRAFNQTEHGIGMIFDDVDE